MVKSLKLAVCPSITIETGNFVSNICNFPHKTSLRVEIDISDHFHKIRLKCEIFSPTFRHGSGT